MTNYLLDTNALSEPPKPQPNAGFMHWFNSLDYDYAFSSVLVLGELKKGARLASSQRQQTALLDWIARIIASFDGRVVTIDTSTTEIWAQLVAKGQQAGKTPSVIDSLLAAQCIQHNLTLVTRNVKDFEQFGGLQLLCPWQ